MPAYRDKRSGRWRYRKRVTLPNGKRVRVTGTPATDTKKAAEHAEAMHVLRVMNPGLMTPDEPAKPAGKEVPTFQRFAEDVYMEKMRTVGNKKKNKPATVASKESHLRCHLYPRFGPMRLDKIDEVAIDEFRVTLAKATTKKPNGVKPKTINNVLATLNNVLKLARKRKLIALVPEIEWLQVGDQPFDFFDFEEGERLLAGAAKVPEWHCAVLLAVKTGMRLGELRALRWGDVDLVKGEITVRRNLWRNREGSPKNGRERVVDVPPSAVQALKKHRHLRGERVFLDLDGNDDSLGAWRHGLYRACRRAGLRVVGWHVLRHTFASHLVMRGESIKVVQELLGHRTIQMTMRYAHLAPGATRAAVARLDDPPPTFGQHAGNTGAKAT